MRRQGFLSGLCELVLRLVGSPAQPGERGGPATAQRETAVDVHLAEYKGLRDLVNTQIAQDRQAISFAVVFTAALLAALPKVVEGALWWIAGAAPPFYFAFAVMNVRAVTGGLEANAYIVCVLRPAVSRLVGEPVLNSEPFFPLIHHWRFPGSARADAPPTGRFMHYLSGTARAVAFLLPCIGLTVVGWYKGPAGTGLPCVAQAGWYWSLLILDTVLAFLAAGGFMHALLMVRRFYKCTRQAREESTVDPLVHYPGIAPSPASRPRGGVDSPGGVPGGQGSEQTDSAGRYGRVT